MRLASLLAVLLVVCVGCAGLAPIAVFPGPDPATTSGCVQRFCPVTLPR